MAEKKIKKINVRITQQDHLYLKKLYKQNTDKYKSFSDYIRHLIGLGYNSELHSFIYPE